MDKVFDLKGIEKAVIIYANYRILFQFQIGDRTYEKAFTKGLQELGINYSYFNADGVYIDIV